MTISETNNKKYKLVIGRHCLVKVPHFLPGAVKEAVSYGSNALMIYLGAPQNTYRRSVTELKILEFQKALVKYGIGITNVIVHAPYLVNLANTINEKKFS